MNSSSPNFPVSLGGLSSIFNCSSSYDELIRSGSHKVSERYVIKSCDLSIDLYQIDPLRIGGFKWASEIPLNNHRNIIFAKIAASLNWFHFSLSLHPLQRKLHWIAEMLQKYNNKRVLVKWFHQLVRLRKQYNRMFSSSLVSILNLLVFDLVARWDDDCWKPRNQGTNLPNPSIQVDTHQPKCGKLHLPSSSSYSMLDNVEEIK